jgi:hypothetical protein
VKRGTVERHENMPRKKSIRKSAQQFVVLVDGIEAFLTAATVPSLAADHVSWLYDHAIVRLYRYFESLVLEALVGAINNDTGTISARVGIRFPKHLSDEVCAYLLVGDGYFDFRGRDGLIKELKRYVPDPHYLVTIVKQAKYKDSLEQLSALRNLAAHDSSVAKARALDATGAQRLRCAGAWLKAQGRFSNLCAKLKDLAGEIEAAAPY